jgi:hypothetical protein
MIELLTTSLTQPAFRFLQVVLERSPNDNEGPPYSVSAQELEDLYLRVFKITPQSREQIDMGDSRPSKTEECVYLLTP